MPIYYLDASSITKLYLRDERGTEFMDKLVRGRMPGGAACYFCDLYRRG